MRKQTSRLTDEQLVELHRLDQPGAGFDQLYKRYVQKVYQKCLTMTGNSEEARDVTHDIFIKIFDKLDSFQNRSSFSTWLYSVSHNYCLDTIKRNKRIKTESISDNLNELTGDISPESVDPHYQLLNLVQCTLSEQELLLLKLKYEQGLSIKEISQRAQLNESTVKMRLKRSRDKLRALVERNE